MECHGYLTSIWFGADLMFCCILLSSGNTEKTLDHCTWIWFETDLFTPSLHEWGHQISQGYGKNQHEGPVREDGALVHWTSNATFWVFANWFGTNTQFLGAVNWTSNLYFIVLFKALDVSVFLDWHEFQGPSRPWRTTNTPSWKIPLAVCPLPCDSWHSAVTSCWPSCWWQTAWRSYKARTFGRLETIEKLHVFMGE